MSVVSTGSISIWSLESAFISHAELDSHADSCCIGKKASKFHETSQTVDVSAFLSTLGQACSVPIVSAALAYDQTYTYETFILIIHQALHFPTKEHNLLNPNQLRLNDVQVHDCPQFLLENSTDLSHLIYFPKEDIKLHLQLDGVISYLPVANIEKDFDEIGKRLSTKITLPMSSNYQPELDVSPVLDSECANYFQS
jgi:hypothetical protein